jgi:phosphopantothenoylcysteine decarboxylase
MARALHDDGWSVHVVVTPAAVDWVDRDAVENVTGMPPASDYRSPGQPKRGPRAKAVVVAPLTFNTLNKWAAGSSDNYALGLLNEALGAGEPIIGVPMINERLWGHPALSPSVDVLVSAGVALLDPRTGDVPCGGLESGTGESVVRSFEPAWVVKRLQ